MIYCWRILSWINDESNMKYLLFTLCCCIFCLPLQSLSAKTQAEDQKNILKALMQIKDTKIPRGNLHCEINEKKGDAYSDVSVGDFIAYYLNWSFWALEGKVHFFALNEFLCEGKETLQCKWVFGATNKPNENWSRSLEFEFDSKNKRINKSSLSCLDVP